ncbi:MAG: hypothetical protein PHO08_01740 [Methylococcales bacterium]|nr:hypothetical protein [Methylococcales bacterium]MDD5630748.1 hypothetical protein [Methylococcales bacterium]
MTPTLPCSSVHINLWEDRHSGRDSRQAILPDALRINANLFQTDLCRNPDYMDVHSSPSLALDTRFPASMTCYGHLCIKMTTPSARTLQF